MTATHAPMPGVDVETTPVDVEFTAPMRGLGPHTAFRLERLGGAEGLYALRANDADLRLFLLDPRSGGISYEPIFSADDHAEIGATGSGSFHVFVVANPADDGVHLNLRAPVIIHAKTGRAAQIILDDQAYPVRARLGG